MKAGTIELHTSRPLGGVGHNVYGLTPDSWIRSAKTAVGRRICTLVGSHRPVLAEVGFHRIVAEPYEAGDGWNTRIQARTMRLVACARCGIEMGD